MTFNDLGLQPPLIKAVEDLGFEKCMPVQEQAIPTIMYQQVNLVALAQTGTGKTAAFGLPILDRLIREHEQNNDSDSQNLLPKGLIICPTRELCIQIANDLKKYAKYISFINIVPIYGGASIEVQIKQLSSRPSIVVATPGRLIDICERKKLNLSHVEYLVLDESDEMLNMGFKEDLDNILDRTPKEKNVYLFSATMPKEVEQIANTYIDNPVRIQIGERNQGSTNVEHFYYMVQQKNRYLALKRIADYYPDIYAIVFCRTKIQTQEIAQMLIKDGYNADALHGDLSQAQRDHVMSRFRLRNIQMLVATDVAARGLDVNNLTHVINYELPDELEQYVHRSGRTGRADNKGISISIINLKQKSKIRQLEKIVKKPITQQKIPTGLEVCRKQLFNLIAKVENVDTASQDIDDLMEEITKQLSWLDRGELIKHFVCLEFNDLLRYYKNSQDLNIDETIEKEKQKRDQNKNAKRSRNFDKSLFTTIKINVGYNQKIVPQRIIGMINENTPSKRVEIGHIDINEQYTLVEIASCDTQDVIDALDGRIIRGKQINIDISEQNLSSDNKDNNNSKRERNSSHRGDDSFSRRKREQRQRNSYSSDRGQRDNRRAKDSKAKSSDRRNSKKSSQRATVSKRRNNRDR